MAILVFSLLFIFFTIEIFSPKKPKKLSNSNYCQPCCSPNPKDRKPNLEGVPSKNASQSPAGNRPSKFGESIPKSRNIKP